MTLSERKSALVELGKYLLSDDDYMNAVIKRSALNNRWFTEEIDKIEFFTRGEVLKKLYHDDTKKFFRKFVPE